LIFVKEIAVVGNKVDLIDKEEVKYDDAKNYANVIEEKERERWIYVIHAFTLKIELEVDYFWFGLILLL